MMSLYGGWHSLPQPTGIAGGGGGTVVGPISSTDNAIVRYNGTTGQLLQNSTVTLGDSGSISGVDTLAFAVAPAAPLDIEGSTHWNPTDQTLDLHTKWGTTLQVGQEDLVIVYNAGADIPDGTPIYPVGGGPGGRPSMRPATADIHSNFDGELLVATAAIPSGTEGPATRFGKVRGLDTSLLSVGTVWLSPSVAGGLTNTRPAFPNYAVQIGGVVVSDASDGELLLAIRGEPTHTINNFWNGVFRESFDFRTSAAGATVSGILTPQNGHDDMTMMFSDGFTMLDTNPGAVVQLTAGTDTNPQTNYVYVPKSTKVLTADTSDWPATEHIKVAEVALQSVAETAASGALRNQNWNDHIQSTTTNQGHLSHICEKLRNFEAQWHSGVAGTCTITGTPDEVYISVTSGVVFQMHRQTFLATGT
jgi:hypothetical protein